MNKMMLSLNKMMMMMMIDDDDDDYDDDGDDEDDKEDDFQCVNRNLVLFAVLTFTFLL